MKAKTATKTKPVPDVRVDAKIKVTKAFAQRFLRRAFLEARFQTVTKPEDAAAGHERWQLWTKGSYGALRPLLEVAGKVEALPAACVVAAYKTLDIEIRFLPPLIIPPKALALMTRQQIQHARRRPTVEARRIKKKLKEPKAPKKPKAKKTA